MAGIYIGVGLGDTGQYLFIDDKGDFYLVSEETLRAIRIWNPRALATAILERLDDGTTS